MNRKNKKSNNTSLKVNKKATPISKSVSVPMSKPQVMHTQRGTRVNNHEVYLPNFAGSAAFASLTIECNPGLDNFTWLSNIANQYSKYHIHNLEFVYVPSVAVATTPGLVVMSADYDCAVNGAPSFVSLSAKEGSSNSAAWEECRLKLQPHLMHSSNHWKLLRCGPKVGSDVQYDPCRLVVGTQDFAGGAAIGAIWAKYDIEFIGAQLIIGKPLPSKVLTITQSTTSTNTATGAQHDVFATTLGRAFNTGYNTLGIVYTPATGNFHLNCGSYLVTMNVCGENDTAELFGLFTSLYVDGVAETRTGAVRVSGGATQELTSSVHWVVAIPVGGANISPRSTMTGAAGYMQWLSTRTYMTIQVI